MSSRREPFFSSIERLGERVALRDGAFQRGLRVVQLGLGDCLGVEEAPRPVVIELGLVRRDLRRNEPRRGPGDLFAPSPDPRLLEGSGCRLCARLCLLDLLGTRTVLELLERRRRLIELRLGHEALGGQIGGLELDEGLPGVDVVPLLHQDRLDPPADARTDGDRPRLDGSAPLVRAPRFPDAPAGVHEQRHGNQAD